MSEKPGVRSAGVSRGHPVMWRRPQVASILAVLIAVSAIAAGLGAIATSLAPRSMEIVGYAGHLGEWEVTAALSRNAPGGASDLSGTMKMKHVGFCSTDGPEVKSGAMQVRLSRFSSKAEVKLQFDGVECTHSADLSDAYIGALVCPDRKAVPLTLWSK